mmetsp:Transcript_118874/g.236863  ORF Transcript_118874/g.236863 Transcript_118874/m.236863 type:complete len:228 (-) Transcript_118874:3-686(-)
MIASFRLSTMVCIRLDLSSIFCFSAALCSLRRCSAPSLFNLPSSIFFCTVRWSFIYLSTSLLALFRKVSICSWLFSSCRATTPCGAFKTSRTSVKWGGSNILCKSSSPSKPTVASNLTKMSLFFFSKTSARLCAADGEEGARGVDADLWVPRGEELPRSASVTPRTRMAARTLGFPGSKREPTMPSPAAVPAALSLPMRRTAACRCPALSPIPCNSRCFAAYWNQMT